MSAQNDFVRGLLLQCGSARLLVPGAAVAEVASFSVPGVIHDVPAWLLGAINWRRVNVPVVGPDHLLGNAEPDITLDTKMLILYGVHEHQQLPFYGMVSQGVPQVLKLSSKMLEMAPLPEKSPAPIKASVTIAGQQALVPDFQRLEQMLVEHFVMRESA